jgi:hypothetical protein
VSEHVDGEEEQLEALQPLVRQAIGEFAMLARRPVPVRITSLLEWLAREAFRRGHAHAHSRHTVKDDLWPDDEVTPSGRT